MEKVNKDFMEKLTSEIKEAILIIARYSSKSFKEISDAEKYALRYNLIVVTEALSSLAIHIVRRVFGSRPETPLQALLILRDKGLLDDYELTILLS
jgi:uncharacterized protein YutE (UPF0331/DUF86 family)